MHDQSNVYRFEEHDVFLPIMTLAACRTGWVEAKKVGDERKFLATA
jgi:hypothetical protein